MKKGYKLFVHKVLFTSKLALVLVLGYMVVRTVLVPKNMREGLAPATALGTDNMLTNKVMSSTKLSLEDYSKIVGRNPFGTVEAGEGVAANSSFSFERPASDELSVALFGTISGHPAVARAIMKDLKTGVLDFYKIGQIVANSRVESIEPEAVTLECNGVRRILRLNATKSAGKGNDTETVPSRTVKKGSDTTGTDLSTQRIDTEMETKFGCMEAILDKANIEPYAVNGRTEGLRITGLENLKAAKDIGLKNGDVVRRVNGQQLTSKRKAFQIFKKAKSQAAVDIELLRDNEIKKLSFTIK